MVSLIYSTCRAQNVVVLNDKKNDYRIGKHIEILHDSKGNLTIDSVTSGRASKMFVRSRSNESNFGFTSDAVWVRFKLKSDLLDSSSWILAEDYSIIDTVSFYVSNGASGYSRQTMGTAFPMGRRAFQARVIAFPLEVKPKESKTIYLRFRSFSDLPVELRIWKPFSFERSEDARELLFGFFYGALLIMAFYNLFLYFSVKDRSYLYYSLYAFAIGYYQFCMDGLRYQYIFPNHIAFVNLDIATAIWLSAAFWILFAKDFLELARYSKAWDKVDKAAVGLSIAGMFYTLLAPGRTSFMLSTPLWFGAVLLNAAAGIFCLRKGNPNARIYLIATSAILIGVPLRGLRVLGVEQSNLLSESAFQIGILIEMTILSFALGNRIKKMRQENEREKAIVRSRIASDLHDEIGSNLSSISVASQMISRRGRLEETERRQLADITATARETAEAIRDIIWFVNPDHDNPEDMILRMKDTTSKFLQGIQSSFECAECKAIKSKDLQFRRNLFLIYKEILNNIVKHSQATCVKIKMDEVLGTFRLEVTDNGIGFDEKNISPGHGDGINNLRRRSNEIGCDLSISSEPGKGTEVMLSMKVDA